MLFERRKVISEADKFIEEVSLLPDEIKDNTIIIIGPMGTGKSTIAKKLVDKLDEIERIPLDSRGILENLYKYESKFHNFKNFEFILTCTVLTMLEKPCIIDFGAGHSIYEDPILRLKMKEICSQFKNIILLLPSENKELSRKILLERRNIKDGSHKDNDNWHFITAPNNYELATDIIYEEGKTIDEISDEIIDCVNRKKIVK